MSQQIGFWGFLAQDDIDEESVTPLWLDNSAAISAAQSKEAKPRSRHFALRYLRVKEQADRIFYCPTKLMKADSLTKTGGEREILLHHLSHGRLPVEEEGATALLTRCVVL